VIAHSFGALSTTLALRDGLAADRVVYLAPACRSSQAVHGFARQFGLSWPVEWELRGEMERRFGPAVWPQFSARVCAPRLTVPALIVHDLDDAKVPLSGGATARALLARGPPGDHRRPRSPPDPARRASDRPGCGIPPRPRDHLGIGGIDFTEKTKPLDIIEGLSRILPGDDLLSHALARAVPSALRGLTAVFGMGTGVSPSPQSPEKRSLKRTGVVLETESG
jgi:hypothetical protein